MNIKNRKIFLAGHNGLVGSNILKLLKKKKFKKIITVEKKDLDLRDQKNVNLFLKKKKPFAVINAAALVGGIKVNSERRGEFIYDNLVIQTNLIHGAYLSNVKNFIFLGSSCIYPRNTNQPIKESQLLTGELEKTNEPYAIAKIAGLKLCESYNFQFKTNYKCLMPCNTYGPNDNYDLSSSHFLPALIKKVHNCKKNKSNELVLWGTGKPKRETIYVEDLADACIYFLNKKTKETLINIGSGYELTILQYAKKICNYFKIKPKIKFTKKNLDGTPRKIINSSVARKYGWKSSTSFSKGLKITIEDFLKNESK